MNIDKALDRINWRIESKSWKANQLDLEAYNSILEWKEKVEDFNLQQNESLAKLWLNNIIMLNERNKLSFKRCLDKIDMILSLDIESSLNRFILSLNSMQLNVILKDRQDYWEALDNNEIGKARKIFDEVVDEKELIKLPDDEKMRKLLASEITRVINKYEK